MDMNRTFLLKKEERQPNWHLIDAKGKVLGRLATHIADILRGKNKPIFTPHTDAGDYVVVINAELIEMTGNKWEGKTYDRYSGWMGGYKTMTAQQMRDRKPEQLIELAVRRMLPKGKLARSAFKKLKVYKGDVHPHKAQLSA